MVTHSPVASDHVADSGQSPTLGLEAGVDRAFLEDLEEFPPLLRRELSRAPRLGAILQRREPPGAVLELSRPLADRGSADTQLPSDLGLGEPAGAEQAAGSEPTFFELLGSESSRLPHARDRKPGRWSCKAIYLGLDQTMTAF